MKRDLYSLGGQVGVQLRSLSISVLAGLLGAAPFVGVVSERASAVTPCARIKPQPQFLADACERGGQEEAKAAMKAFLREYQQTDPTATCLSCHSRVNGTFPLKASGLKRATEAGMK